MRFETRQRIEGTLEEVEKALLDERYIDFMLQHHGDLLEVQQLERHEAGSCITRKIRYRPRPVIEKVGTKTVPPEWFSFVQTSTLDLSRHEMTFRNVPTTAKIAHMVENQGHIRLTSKGSVTERFIEGEISLKLPFLLKPFAMIGEKVIQTEGVKLLDKDVPVINRFIEHVLRQK